MFGNRSFLMLGSSSAADIISLIKGGCEVQEFRFSFDQGIDSKGKATTRVYSGILNVTLSQLPPKNIIEWALRPRKFSDGVIVVVDAENMPLEKIFFKDTICTSFDINYVQKGDSYATTKLVLNAKKLIVGNGVDFDNEWTV